MPFGSMLLMRRAERGLMTRVAAVAIKIWKKARIGPFDVIARQRLIRLLIIGTTPSPTAKKPLYSRKLEIYIQINYHHSS